MEKLQNFKKKEYNNKLIYKIIIYLRNLNLKFDQSTFFNT